VGFFLSEKTEKTEKPSGKEEEIREMRRASAQSIRDCEALAGLRSRGSFSFLSPLSLLDEKRGVRHRENENSNER